MNHFTAIPPRNRRRGNTLIEMVIVLPVLLSLSMGGIEFGYCVYMRHVVQSASTAGARAAVLSTGTQSRVTTAISDSMTSAGFGSSGFTSTVKNKTTNATISDVSTVVRGTEIEVTVSMTFGSGNVRPLGFIPTAKVLTGATVMLKE